MGSQMSIILYNGLIFIRWAGMIVIAGCGMVLLISEGVKSKLSPGKLIGVTLSALMAGILFWTLPTLLNYARVDSNSRIVQDQPIGGMYRQ
ncbi:hypothetical protein ACQPZ2_13335 [Nocardia pseudovaccinii]|uniref:hypothetical protein n=2 Tax=Nocardia pseudovaccinii TaxID=189540 RepID=UPI0007A50280